MHRSIDSAIWPLRAVFWGAILMVLDFTINGFDILNDTLAAVLIASACQRLSRLDVDGRYSRLMEAVSWVALLTIVTTLLPYVRPLPLPVSVLRVLFGFAQILAAIAFCVSMKRLSSAAGLASAASWATTTRLMAWIWGIPLGLFHLVVLWAMVAGSEFRVDPGLAAIPAMGVLVAPLCHFFVSTSRMRRESRDAPADEIDRVPLLPPGVGGWARRVFGALLIVVFLGAVALQVLRSEAHQREYDATCDLVKAPLEQAARSGVETLDAELDPATGDDHVYVSGGGTSRNDHRYEQYVTLEKSGGPGGPLAHVRVVCERSEGLSPPPLRVRVIGHEAPRNDAVIEPLLRSLEAAGIPHEVEGATAHSGHRWPE